MQRVSGTERRIMLTSNRVLMDYSKIMKLEGFDDEKKYLYYDGIVIWFGMI